MATNQGKLRGVLALSYLLLILLLMLGNCHGCDREPETDAPAPQELPTEEAREAEERAENVGGDGEIKVTALWDFPGDVDLHVIQPNGNELWFRNMKDRRTGGELDVDNIPGGYGSAENVFWTNPESGTYKVDLVMYTINEEAPNGGTVNVVIKVGERRQTIPVRLSYSGQRVHVKTINYHR
ncbi:MAG: hypothetical protein K2M55_03880 [Muribaculaceae bacterium]|nr:hypothetical protein [Muribaculaceae bacterium]